MSWVNGFLNVAVTGMHREDLRQRVIRAKSAAELPYGTGVAHALETSMVLAIHESALLLKQDRDDLLEHEKPYPDEPLGKNPRRADLAFKEGGKGKNWYFIEVKKYSPEAIREDIEKLRTIARKTRRFLLVYRVSRTKVLRGLLTRRFPELAIVGHRSFPTFAAHRQRGVCEIVLASVEP